MERGTEPHPQFTTRATSVLPLIVVQNTIIKVGVDPTQRFMIESWVWQTRTREGTTGELLKADWLIFSEVLAVLFRKHILLGLCGLSQKLQRTVSSVVRQLLGSLNLVGK